MTRDEIQARIAVLEQLEAELDASLLDTRRLLEVPPPPPRRRPDKLLQRLRRFHPNLKP